jgi:transcriptional regulator with XRE-family HTH domain
VKTNDEIKDNSKLLKQFGKKLKGIRKEKGWSQEKLALESGIARSYIGDVERGIRNIALLNICKIADTLEIEVQELMKFRINDTISN